MNVKQVIASALCISIDRVTDDISVDTCPEWTSLEQIALISALESACATEFDIMESIEMDSYEGIKGVLEARGIDIDD